MLNTGSEDGSVCPKLPRVLLCITSLELETTRPVGKSFDDLSIESLSLDVKVGGISQSLESAEIPSRRNSADVVRYLIDPVNDCTDLQDISGMGRDRSEGARTAQRSRETQTNGWEG